jgi:RNA polymerase sigma factor (TIGR02999 family)
LTPTILPAAEAQVHESPLEITRLLKAHRDGDPAAFGRVLDDVYPILRRIAGKQLRSAGGGGTLDAASLINEVYLRLVDDADRTWQNRSHFFAVTARAMRQIVIDHARRRSRAKRGGGAAPLELDPERIAVAEEAERLVIMNQALERLGAQSPLLLQVVECRFFAGMTVGETAEALGVSERSVERHWSEAKAALRAELER